MRLRSAVILGLLALIPIGLSARQVGPATDSVVSTFEALARIESFSSSELTDLLNQVTPGQMPVLEVSGKQIKLDKNSIQLLRDVIALRRSIEVVDVRATSHIMLVDAKGAIHIIDLLANTPRLSQFHPPFTNAESDAIEAAYRGGAWYIVRGWDPPGSEPQALELGIQFRRGALRDPPMPWIAPVSTDQLDPNGNCSLYTIRNGGRATLFSVCRTAKSFLRRSVATGPFRRILGARDGSLAVIETKEQLTLVSAAGQEIARIPAKSAEFGWVGPTDLLVYGNDLGQRDAVVNVKTGASRLVMRCDTVEIGAIERFEASAPGKRAAFLLADDQVVEWDEARGCAVPG
ncbi:hypothetical protein MCERH10_01263 [Caulobacteraceae bacterium]